MFVLASMAKGLFEMSEPNDVCTFIFPSNSRTAHHLDDASNASRLLGPDNSLLAWPGLAY